MTKRRKARELALQFLYETDGNPVSLETKINSFYREFASESLLRNGFIDSAQNLYSKKESVEIHHFFVDLVNGTLNNIGRIDGLIKNASKNWVIERMSRIDRNLLRLSVYEMLYFPETPKNVVINEAVEIAKKFGNEESSAFINGILDNIKIKEDNIIINSKNREAAS